METSISSLSPSIRIPKTRKAVLAKNELERIIRLVDSCLQDHFESEKQDLRCVSNSQQQVSALLLDHVQEHCLRPAKRLRASFVYHSYKMLGGDREQDILNASLCVELVHTALLMHDDFMDRDSTRRGLPTTHEFFKNYHKVKNYRGNSSHYGESMAVDAGDVALCLGFEILGKSNFPLQRRLNALNRLLRGISNTAFGQAYDLNLEASSLATQQNILDLHHAKSAIYTYENPLHIGAILAGAKTNDLDILSEYAIPGGIAFQLQDDILGLFGNPVKTGKPAHSDLRQGKMTLLIIKAMENATKKQKQLLEQVWGKKSLTDSQAETARKIVISTGSLQHSRDLAIKLAKKAQKSIGQMKEKRWNKSSVNYLDGIAQYMVERDL